MKQLVQIESGFPCPEKRRSNVGKMAQLRQLIKQLSISKGIPQDGSFSWPEDKMPYRAAKDLGYRIKIAKQNNNGWRVWRVK